MGKKKRISRWWRGCDYTFSSPIVGSYYVNAGLSVHCSGCLQNHSRSLKVSHPFPILFLFSSYLTQHSYHDSYNPLCQIPFCRLAQSGLLVLIFYRSFCLSCGSLHMVFLLYYHMLIYIKCSNIY